VPPNDPPALRFIGAATLMAPLLRLGRRRCRIEAGSCRTPPRRPWRCPVDGRLVREEARWAGALRGLASLPGSCVLWRRAGADGRPMLIHARLQSRAPLRRLSGAVRLSERVEAHRPHVAAHHSSFPSAPRRDPISRAPMKNSPHVQRRSAERVPSSPPSSSRSPVHCQRPFTHCTSPSDPRRRTLPMGSSTAQPKAQTFE